jgi:iron(III) transport system ATP-binding protein
MLRVNNLSKTYGKALQSIRAVRQVSFEIKLGEVFTLLGPSGCGKSTILRCIAGLETPDQGEVWLGDRVVFDARRKVDVPVHQRGVGMVFQSYALWPHMSVFDNVAFPLRQGRDRAPERQIRDKVMSVLQLVQMESLANRPVPLLSGGQQQRVALARALVYEPDILLLDEPLSNLDAKLRLQMRSELQALITRLRVTTLYVTHDQEEALVISGRIAVMQEGMTAQVGEPRNVYRNPASAYVAGFVGNMNFFEGSVVSQDGDGAIWVECTFGSLRCGRSETREPLKPGDRVWVTIRPEHTVVRTSPCNVRHNGFPGMIVRVEYLGSRLQCEVSVGAETCRAEVGDQEDFSPGDAVEVELPPERTMVMRR